jgi:hypothetical protein
MPVVIDGTLGVTAQEFTSTGGIFENAQTISANTTISTNYNALSAGPITIANNITVTIPTGSNWVIT